MVLLETTWGQTRESFFLGISQNSLSKKMTGKSQFTQDEIWQTKGEVMGLRRWKWTRFLLSVYPKKIHAGSGETSVEDFGRTSGG